MDAFARHARAGDLCLCVSSLHVVRNVRIKFLCRALGPELFDQRVRVLGGRALDDAAEARMLPKLVWQQMQGAVVDYECQLLEL
eukprot:15410625-Alexandrium_andersonii.AAC.1